MIRRIPVHHEIPPNPIGDDWICSDVHGEFQLLMELLGDSGFESAPSGRIGCLCSVGQYYSGGDITGRLSSGESEV
ncbi:MAG: hypothetical protein V7751_02675 [Pseudoalteromonas distincta]|tara:strand:+ start:5414 stop:5641 length:228 start_codon:yes stop_codon:yes gene_type:complete